MRKRCKECTRKHLAQAYVLHMEALNGHLDHIHYVIGHLAEAEAECPSPEIAYTIRNVRKTVEVDLNAHVDYLALIQLVMEN